MPNYSSPYLGIDLKKFLNNDKLSYFLLLIVVLFIGGYNLLNLSVKQTIVTLVTYPIVLVIILSTILIIGYYNISLGILLGVALFVVLYPLSDGNNTIENFTQLHDDMEIIEGFNNQKAKRRHRREEFTKKNKSREETINEFKNYFKNIFKEAENEEKEEMEDMIKENLNIKLENERRNNDRHRAPTNTRNNKGVTRESMVDVIQKNTTSDSQSDQNDVNNNTNTQLIKLREFDPANEEDTNLLITKEVLQDIINRITYQYESNMYLKRYMSSRLQEIVKLNNLLADDE